MRVFMNQEGNKFNILDSAGVSLIWPNLGSQQNELLNMFITVWPKAGNGFELAFSPVSTLPWFLPSSPLSILSLLSARLPLPSYSQR